MLNVQQLLSQQLYLRQWEWVSILLWIWRSCCTNLSVSFSEIYALATGKPRLEENWLSSAVNCIGHGKGYCQQIWDICTVWALTSYSNYTMFTVRAGKCESTEWCWWWWRWWLWRVIIIGYSFIILWNVTVALYARIVVALLHIKCFHIKYYLTDCNYCSNHA